MTTQRLAGRTALVTGASRGFGRGIAAALTQSGAAVVGLARNETRLAAVGKELGDSFTPVVADVADPVSAGQLLDQFDPDVLVLNAGAAPLSRPQLTPATELGAAAVAAYAAREGMTVAEFTTGRGPSLTPDQAGASIAQLIADPGLDQPSYLLTAAGLSPLT